MQLFHLTRSAVIQIAKTVQWSRSRKNWKRHAGTWLSRLPLTKMEISAGTSSWPSRISHFTGSFVGHSPSEMLCPPAWKLKINHEESNQTSSAPKSTERSFTSIQMVHTHTYIYNFLYRWIDECGLMLHPNLLLLHDLHVADLISVETR